MNIIKTTIYIFKAIPIICGNKVSIVTSESKLLPLFMYFHYRTTIYQANSIVKNLAENLS